MNTKGEWTFEYEGDAYEVKVRPDRDSRRNSINSKAYVCDVDRVEPSPSLAEIHARAVELGAVNGYTVRGAYPEIDKMWDEHNRQIVAAKRDLFLAALRAGDPTWTGLSAGDKLTFSRKAGCSCGCSPGFITNLIGSRNSMWVSKIPSEKVDDSWVKLAGGAV